MPSGTNYRPTGSSITPQAQREALEAHAKAKGYPSLNAYTKALYEADSGLCMEVGRE